MTYDEPSRADYNDCISPGECALCNNTVCEADDGECECSLNGEGIVLSEIGRVCVGCFETAAEIEEN